MSAAIFEGYVGIRTGDEQFVYDTLLVLIILLLTFFGVIFRAYYPLFMKMIGSLFSTRERRNFFDTSVKSNFFFAGFLKFQALFLCSLFFYAAFFSYTGISNRNLLSAITMLFVFFCIIYVFYLLKRCLYVLYGRVFSENNAYKLWDTNYHILSYLWGISLYFPALWLLLDHRHLMEELILFASFYLLFRFTLIYMTVRIFYNKNTGLLYISSYLCAQEIIPLLFLYEGLNYLYNTFEASTLCH
ncbi:MAG: DUF4271 domain-containing protein [Tannerella sp.]|jgi:hypothetical protein|nr:DUF4271 domain-containing protein [Tannerella sp.]